jgi:predicted acyltransferase
MDTEISSPKRSYALDALRGFAILTMLLSGQIPFGVLPSWMYHAQVPPPLHKFMPGLAGITWVDLVFPFFLFSMGAAIPLSISRKIEKGVPQYKIISSIILRGFILVGFAIFDLHIRPGEMKAAPDIATYLYALLGFLLLFPALARFPYKMSPVISALIKVCGVVGIVVFLALVRYPDGSGFIAERSDIILLVLANIAISASLIWYFTRSNLLLRLGILGFLFAARLIHTELSWGKWLWHSTPLPWFGMLYFQQYLFIVLPGTVIGDLILKWMKSDTALKQNETVKEWSKSSLIVIAGIMFIFVLACLVGLKSRLVFETLLGSIGLMLITWGLISKAKTPTEIFIRKIFQWGSYLLLLGLAFEPYEGGIKKDHPTMSYYFVTAGLAIFMLIAFTIIIDVFKKKKWVQLLINNGQNPMIAYVGITNLMPPILGITGLGVFLDSMFPTPWLGVLKAVMIVLTLALIVSFFTKRKIFWRT